MNPHLLLLKLCLRNVIYRQDVNFFIKIINPANFKGMNILHSVFENEILK